MRIGGVVSEISKLGVGSSSNASKNPTKVLNPVARTMESPTRNGVQAEPSFQSSLKNRLKPKEAKVSSDYTTNEISQSPVDRSAENTTVENRSSESNAVSGKQVEKSIGKSAGRNAEKGVEKGAEANVEKSAETIVEPNVDKNTVSKPGEFFKTHVSSQAPVIPRSIVPSEDEFEETQDLSALAAPPSGFNPEAAALIKFLVAMKMELGVEPQKIVEAMAELDPQSLVEPPEDTMVDVLQKLQLSPPQQGRAEELYQVMLKDSAEASMGRMLSEKQQSADFNVLGPEEIQQQRIIGQIDSLTKDFFSKPVLNANNSMQVSSEKTQKVGDKRGFIIMGPNGEIVRTQDRTDSGATPESTLDQLLNELRASALKLDTVGSEGASGSAKPSAFDLSQTGDTTAMNMAGPHEGQSRTDFDQGETNDTEDFSDARGEAQEITSREGEQEFSSQPSLSKVNSTGNTSVNSKSVLPGTPPVNTGEDAVNTRKLVESAQLLAQKGGGSMKIQMRPEGLGYVELKVAVKGDKVDVQMIAESNETKRLLENSLTELKSSLVQHKLNLEQVQVNSSLPTQGGLDTMLGQDREMAREFLDQFREFNQNRREAGHFEFGGINGLAQKGKKLRPENVQYPNAKAKARRLDLVA